MRQVVCSTFVKLGWILPAVLDFKDLVTIARLSPIFTAFLSGKFVFGKERFIPVTHMVSGTILVISYWQRIVNKKGKYAKKSIRQKD